MNPMLNSVSELSNRSRLFHAVIVSLINNRSFSLNTKSLLKFLPNFHNAIPISAVCRPDTQFVSFGSDVDHSSTDVFTGFFKCLTNQTQYLDTQSKVVQIKCMKSSRNKTHHFKPIIVQFRRSLFLLQTYEPSSTIVISGVLPHGLDSSFEQRVITACRELTC